MSLHRSLRQTEISFAVRSSTFLSVSEVPSEIGSVYGRRADDVQSRIDHPCGYLVGGRFPYETDITEGVDAQPLRDPATDRSKSMGGNKIQIGIEHPYVCGAVGVAPQQISIVAEHS